MKKIIVGLLGCEKSGRTTAAKIFAKNGFRRASINKKVEEFASHLFSEEEMSKNKNVILNRIRQRGASVNKEYWLNLVLISVTDKTDYIVFDDISLEETSNSKIVVFQIYRPDVSSDRLDDVETIENDGTLKDFTKKIEDLSRRLIS